MRHGEAGEAASDVERLLTKRGEAQARSSAQGLARRGIRVPVIWHSPYARARQTAIIVAEVLGSKLVEDARFAPAASPERAADAVMAEGESGKGDNRGPVFVVAHMPILPAIVDLLGGGVVSFGTATVAHLHVVGGSAVVSGLWSAEFLSLVR